MRTFSFRAECQVDVDALRALVALAAENGQWTVLPDPRGLPDVAVEVLSTITIERLLDLMREVEDGHVMLQTLRPVPLAENSLERDFDAE
jgi:hypothetical protein